MSWYQFWDVEWAVPNGSEEGWEVGGCKIVFFVLVIQNLVLKS